MVMVGCVVVDGVRRERGEMFRRVVVLVVMFFVLYYDVFVVVIVCLFIIEFCDVMVYFCIFVWMVSGFFYYEIVAYVAS